LPPPSSSKFSDVFQLLHHSQQMQGSFPVSLLHIELSGATSGVTKIDESKIPLSVHSLSPTRWGGGGISNPVVVNPNPKPTKHPIKSPANYWSGSWDSTKSSTNIPTDSWSGPWDPTQIPTKNPTDSWSSWKPSKRPVSCSVCLLVLDSSKVDCCC
jgi:hypothetical protein